MKVVHMLLNGASRYDRANAEIDMSGESGAEHTMLAKETTSGSRSLDKVVRSTGAAIVHVHGSSQPPRRAFAGLTVPWVSDRPIPLPRTIFRKIAAPAAILLDRVPEAVGDEWFVEADTRKLEGANRVGVYVRSPASRNNVEQVAGRIQRFRDDVTWTLYENPPTPDELASLDLWIDPATGEDDLEGMVPEALACLTPVVAARTTTNKRRLDEGKAGILVPVGDHNEMTHAVLNALFKPEIVEPLTAHAKQIRDRFRPRHRQQAVLSIYEEVAR